MQLNLLARYFIALCFFFTGIDALSQRLPLSTQSDSAKYYYYEGWRQVMDAGNYTASEAAYRKMMKFDHRFLVGLSLVVRITHDFNERQHIESLLEERKSELNGDERLLLDNYIELVKLTNLRVTDPETAKQQVRITLKANEDNLKVIVHRYPDEIYYKAEYIEVIHHNYGARQALDSLYKLASLSQQNKPFLLGYAAQLEAETGDFETALNKARQLSKQTGYKNSPKPYVVYSDIYLRKGNLKKARQFVDQAILRDPGNIDAQRLKKSIMEGKK